MTKLEDLLGIERNNSVLPTHNLTATDNNLKYLIQKALSKVVEGILLFLLNSKLRLESVIQNYRQTLPTSNDNRLHLSQRCKSRSGFSTNEKLVSKTKLRFDTQEIVCLCLSVPLLIILGFLTILRPTFKTEEPHYEEIIINKNYSPDLKYFIQNHNDTYTQKIRFSMANKLFMTNKNADCNNDFERNSVRYNVVGINSLKQAKSKENLLFDTTLFHYSDKS